MIATSSPNHQRVVVPTLRITPSAIQPAVRGATLSASGDDAAPLVLWLPIEGADFKSQRSSTTLTHAACTIIGRKVDRSFRSTRS
jgi:hypothetical protein